ncbi:MAG: phosphatase PAP2 family protein [Candidatus Gracilibacteria bacterium]|nr:phosphatase PAP2 family protein [Candidatus Gracilibacteria bacterium]
MSFIMLSFLISQDIALLNYLRSFIDPNSALQVKIIHIGSDIEVALVMLVLIGLWLYGVYKKNNQFKIDALMMLYSIGLAFLIYIILNLGLPLRPRPETVSSIRPLVDHLPDNSFPSGHGIFAGASIFAAFLYTRRCIAGILLISGIFMLLSRILAGIHYPGDIFIGSIIGAIGAYIIYILRNKKFMTEYLLVYPVKIAKFFKL